VMYDANVCGAKVTLVETSRRFEAGHATALVQLTGTARISSTQNLQFGDTVLSDQKPFDLNLDPGACALAIMLKLRG
jgi:hypothetical protein